MGLAVDWETKLERVVHEVTLLAQTPNRRSRVLPPRRHPSSSPGSKKRRTDAPSRVGSSLDETPQAASLNSYVFILPTLFFSFTPSPKEGGSACEPLGEHAG